MYTHRLLRSHSLIPYLLGLKEHNEEGETLYLEKILADPQLTVNDLQATD